jgi:hypothetical protein
MGANAHDDSRQGGAFLADYATFAEFLEKLNPLTDTLFVKCDKIPYFCQHKSSP